ncbi:hypothetical protein TVAG_411160 [Trichomonas vaginalis G3]|uniref:Uncharacterized protein n=1 Tax=Trichomonas vaginalis (strain ATCC PRA-98 / G3) TaxID=412133 RepID=A2DXM1_TRIV3|nr:GTP binding [Trichomonas vaginalis G3]EAY14850.1 hypothetical protein TVAG_411160 [Trichomonas vaginalis G3]KAI5541169.1 GTP binding [Trichomonas vaginalis G3]|eukprot:XP_001327073.1 hypothetical protein [Trichomonas vaginalis G3]
MGRHRTHHAAQKLITDIHKKLDTKRNRDVKLKMKRAKHQEAVKQRILQNQAEMAALDAPAPKVSQKIKRHINEKFMERVQASQTTYDALIQLVDNCDGAIIVVDARDADACRFINVEHELSEKKKPIMFVITKIDLVPRDAVEKWIAHLTQVAPTVAISLNSAKPDNKILKQIQDFAADLKKVAVLGPQKIGKTKLIELLKAEKFEECPPYKWTLCGVDLALIDSFEWKGRAREFAISFIERLLTSEKSPGINLIEKLEIKKPKSPGDILAQFGIKRGVAKHESGEAFVKALTDKEWKWVSIPDVEDKCEISPEQTKELEQSCNEKSSDFVYIGQDVTIRTDDNALRWIPPVQSDSESEEEQTKDDDEKEKDDKENGNEEEDDE